MSSSYTGNPTATQAPGSAPGPGVAPIMTLPADGDPANAASVAQAFKESADYIAWLTQRTATALFGTGADGSVTLDGTVSPSWASKVGSVYTLTRDVSFVNLTINAGVQLKTAGFIIVGKGKLTTNGASSIVNPGSAAVTTTGGAGAVSGTLGAGFAGANSVTGAGAAGTNATTSYGGAGGAGGLGNGGAGGAGGTTTIPAAALGSAFIFRPGSIGYVLGLSSGTPTLTVLRGGAGGGGGGGDGGVGNGGAGGGGGGVVVIGFQQLQLSTAGDIVVAGGAGSNTNANNGGGGGGGGGGALLLYYYVKNAITFSGATNCPGGTFGTGLGTGVSGSAGSAGTVIEYALSS